MPEALWDGTYDCCAECADEAAAAGNHWREWMAEDDRLRLIGEFTD